MHAVKCTTVLTNVLRLAQVVLLLLPQRCARRNLRYHRPTSDFPVFQMKNVMPLRRRSNLDAVNSRTGKTDDKPTRQHGNNMPTPLSHELGDVARHILVVEVP